MIAKITNGTRVGDIAAYLHGPGRANEHRYRIGGDTRPGGVLIGGNLSWEGHTGPAKWVGDMREELKLRPEANKPVWQCSLRNAPGDQVLSDAQWAEAGQHFAESMGFEGPPWVMVRHGEDHVHLVVTRVDFEGQLWARANDRWEAQKATSALEDAYGLEKAPRTWDTGEDCRTLPGAHRPLARAGLRPAPVPGRGAGQAAAAPGAETPGQGVGRNARVGLEAGPQRLVRRLRRRVASGTGRDPQAAEYQRGHRARCSGGPAKAPHPTPGTGPGAAQLPGPPAPPRWPPAPGGPRTLRTGGNLADYRTVDRFCSN